MRTPIPRSRTPLARLPAVVGLVRVRLSGLRRRRPRRRRIAGIAVTRGSSAWESWVLRRTPRPTTGCPVGRSAQGSSSRTCRDRRGSGRSWIPFSPGTPPVACPDRPLPSSASARSTSVTSTTSKAGAVRYRGSGRPTWWPDRTTVFQCSSCLQRCWKKLSIGDIHPRFRDAQESQAGTTLPR